VGRTFKSECAVCRRHDRAQIEAARASGESLRTIAERFSLSGKDVIHRHFRDHVTPDRRAALMLGEAKIEELTNAAARESRTLLDRMNIATSILFNRLIVNAEIGDDQGLSMIAGKLAILFRQYAELTGELRQASSITINQNTLNVIATPEFVALQSGLLNIARAHPEAKADIIALLRGLDTRGAAPAHKASPLTIEAAAVDAA
jgi:hypothetical protein